MPIPECKCRVDFNITDPNSTRYVRHCALHRAAGDLFEIVDMLVSLREVSTSHKKGCTCVHCRSVRALKKARGMN